MVAYKVGKSRLLKPALLTSSSNSMCVSMRDWKRPIWMKKAAPLVQEAGRWRPQKQRALAMVPRREVCWIQPYLRTPRCRIWQSKWWAFYNDKMDEGFKSSKDNFGIQRASIVDWKTLTFRLLWSSDGATLYITRDIAAAIYRARTTSSKMSMLWVKSRLTTSRQLRLFWKDGLTGAMTYSLTSDWWPQEPSKTVYT